MIRKEKNKGKVRGKAEKLESHLKLETFLLYRAMQKKKKRNVQNSSINFLPFHSASAVEKFLDAVKGAAEVTAKDCLKVVFVPATPSVGADVFPTVGSK